MKILIRLWDLILWFLCAFTIVLLGLSSIICWLITGKKLPSKHTDWIFDYMEKLEEK